MLDLAAKFKSLADAHGAEYLLAVFCYHHVLKGFVLCYTYTSFDFVLRTFHVRGPRMQLLKAVAMLPWALKPLLGILSDTCPIAGLRKTPYIVAATVVGTVSYAIVGFCGDELPLEVVVAAFVAMSTQIATCDLLMEAATAERLCAAPQLGPLLMSFVTGGTTLGELAAAATVGTVLEVAGPFGPCAVCALPSLVMLVPAVGNWLGESWEPPAVTRARRRAVAAQSEVLVLGATTGAASVALVAIGLTPGSVAHKLRAVVAVAATTVGAFAALLNPKIGLMIAFFFLQSVSTISLDGGTFYFFTDDVAQYPLGPHFSTWFYTTGLGLAAGVCGLLGLLVYNSCLAQLRYRSLFLLSNALWCAVSAVNVLVFTRRNLDLGIPDEVFVLGGSMLQNVFERWAYVPGGILLSQVCPRGLEATMFALLAGCLNLGHAVAAFFGAFMLTELGVSPDGTAGDRTQFASLWRAAACQALAPLVTLWLVPAMIPDAAQVDRVIEDDAVVATRGSPWSKLRAAARWRASAAPACLAGTGCYGTMEGASQSGGTGGCGAP